MKKSIIILIISVTIVLLVLSSLVVFASKENQAPKLEDKVLQEIDYLDKYMVSLLKNFGDNTNWELVQKQIEELYGTWNTISIDLISLNINSNLILNFNDFLNSSIQNIKSEDKQKSMESIIRLYQLLPQYSESFNPNGKETNVLKIKSNVVAAYVNVSNEKWQEAQNQLTEATNQFTNLLNSVGQDFHNQTAVNQCYVMINELNKAVGLQDKDIFFIEYQNLIEKIEVI